MILFSCTNLPDLDARSKRLFKRTTSIVDNILTRTGMCFQKCSQVINFIASVTTNSFISTYDFNDHPQADLIKDIVLISSTLKNSREKFPSMGHRQI